MTQDLPTETVSGNVRNLTDVYEQAVVKDKAAECGNSKRLSGIVPTEGPAIEMIANTGLIRYRGVDGPSPSIEVRLTWPASLTRSLRCPSPRQAAALMAAPTLVSPNPFFSSITDSRHSWPLLSMASITLAR